MTDEVNFDPHLSAEDDIRSETDHHMDHIDRRFDVEEGETHHRSRSNDFHQDAKFEISDNEDGADDE